ncbi:MAG: ATP-binding cassette domain-containing protein, partial [Acidiferrobacterales bacterium]
LFLPLELNNRLDAEACAVAQELLAEVGLADRSRSYPDRLSGGEQQRIAIARALVHKPRLVLADEPTGNLDLDTGRHIVDMMMRMRRAVGASVVMVSHSADAVGLADRAFNIEGGQLIPVKAEAS